jgi:hypothetical protein
MAMFLLHIAIGLYSNKETEVFETISNGEIIPFGIIYSGIAWGDYDNDGNADLFVSSMKGTLHY